MEVETGMNAGIQAPQQGKDDGCAEHGIELMPVEKAPPGGGENDPRSDPNPAGNGKNMPCRGKEVGRKIHSDSPVSGILPQTAAVSCGTASNRSATRP